MKKTILITTIFLLAVALLFTLSTNVKAASTEIKELTACTECAEKQCTAGSCDCTKCVAQVVVGEKVTCYDSVNAALNSVTDGGKVLLLKDVKVPFTPTGEDVSNDDAKRITRSEKTAATFTFDLNGHSITSESGHTKDTAVFAVKDGSNITFEDSKGNGKIVHNGYGSALAIFNGTATIKSGSYLSKGESPDSGKNYAAVSLGEDTKAGILTVNGGTINGISLFGTGSKVTVNDGIITDDSFAIAGNGSADGRNATKNATIIINGGTLESTGSAAIYQPNDGTLEIDKGTITGKIGVVARDGNVTIKGGTIVGTGTEQIQVGDLATQLQSGYAVLVDDNASGYGDNTVTVGVENATLKTTQDEPIANVKSDDDSMDAIYTLPELEVTVKTEDDKAWYFGAIATEEAEKAAKVSGSEIEVIKGNLALTGVADGVQVKNSGTGEVTANGIKAEPGKELDMTKENLKLKVEELQEKANNLQTELDKATATNEKLSTDIAKAQTDLKNTSDKLTQTLDSLKEEANKNIAELTKVIESLQNKLEELEEQYESLISNSEQENENPAENTDEEPSEEPAEGELDNEPKTGVVGSMVPYVSALVSLAGAVVSKRFVK